MEGLHPFSRQIFARYPVRKKAAQKAAFRQEVTQQLQAAGWLVYTQSTKGMVPSHNLVVGDVKRAKYIFTAHYDTPARLPVPNFIAPCNLLVTLLYQLLLTVVLIALPLGGMWLFGLVWSLSTRGDAIPFLGLMLVLWGTLVAELWLLVAGPANKSNANDNTSGVLTLLEIALALPEALRPQVALVFFDNEELGLLGSAAFRKAYGSLSYAALLNFDCVGDGDTLLFVQPKAVRKDAALQRALAEAFVPAGQKRVKLDTSPLTFYPSDQMMLSKGVGVAALRIAPVLGLWVGRIHTRRDTVLDGANLALLREGALRLAEGAAPG